MREEFDKYCAEHPEPMNHVFRTSEHVVEVGDSD